MITWYLSSPNLSYYYEKIEEPKQKMGNPILCVGLVCIDKFLLVKSYPKEDSDQQGKLLNKSRGF